MSYRPVDPVADDGNGSRKRSRPEDMHGLGGVPMEDNFQHEDGDGDDDDDDDSKGKKAGRRKIKIEFIQDKSRRHITFSKRKAGIMKKAYELSTLTGTQVLLLVVSETGLVYTFTTAKLQPLVTQPEGKNLIQACLNAPAGQPPSSFPVGQPIGRAAAGSSNSSSAPPPPQQSARRADDDSERSESPQQRPRRAAASNRQSYHETSESPPQDVLSPPQPSAQQQAPAQSYGASAGGPGAYAQGNGSYYSHPHAPPPPSGLGSFPPMSSSGGADWGTSYQRR